MTLLIFGDLDLTQQLGDDVMFDNSPGFCTVAFNEGFKLVISKFCSHNIIVILKP